MAEMLKMLLNMLNKLNKCAKQIFVGLQVPIISFLKTTLRSVFCLMQTSQLSKFAALIITTTLTLTTLIITTTTLTIIK